MTALRPTIFFLVLFAKLVFCWKLLPAEPEEDCANDEHTDEWYNERACKDEIKSLVESYADVTGLTVSEVEMMLAEEKEELLGERWKRSVTYNTFHLYHKKLWLDATVPYVFDKDMNEENRTNCKKAMDMLSEISCLKFVERTNERHYVLFMEVEPGSNEGHVCHADDYPNSKGILEVEMRDCEGTSDIVHELLHTLGFVHEHSRPDRDEYVRVEWCKIPEEDREQYCKLPKLFAGEYDTPYDYNSLLHYDDEFLIIKDTSVEEIVKPTKLSETDVKKINELYCTG